MGLGSISGNSIGAHYQEIRQLQEIAQVTLKGVKKKEGKDRLFRNNLESRWI